MVPSGGVVIDSPGMREIQMWAGEDDLEETFEDIASLASRCRFKDCRHETEPGCAVRTALEGGGLDISRFESFQKLQREISYHEARESGSLRLQEKLRWRKISRAVRAIEKDRDRR